jgi:hypothetical protein
MISLSKYSLPLPTMKSRLTPTFDPRKTSGKVEQRRMVGSRFLGGPPLRAA